MGQYVTQEGLLRRLTEEHLAQLTDDAGTGEIDSDRLGEAIADAEAEVDAHIQERYVLPLATVPPLLTRIAADLAVWQLFGRRQLSDEAVEGRYKAAVKLLEKLASGAISLGLDPPAAETAGSTLTNKTDDDRLFPKSVLDEY